MFTQLVRLGAHYGSSFGRLRRSPVCDVIHRGHGCLHRLAHTSYSVSTGAARILLGSFVACVIALGPFPLPWHDLQDVRD
ncbi:hypothetical protein BDW60DRAFT_172424 [Aspergillus nidulans var. acristatus]